MVVQELAEKILSGTKFFSLSKMEIYYYEPNFLVKYPDEIFGNSPSIPLIKEQLLLLKNRILWVGTYAHLVKAILWRFVHSLVEQDINTIAAVVVHVFVFGDLATNCNLVESQLVELIHWLQLLKLYKI